MSQCFQINAPQVVCETIDGEVVIVHLERGYYYSLLKSGADVWNGIEKNGSRLNVIHNLTQIYEGSEAEIATAVDEFLDELLKEDLIVAVDNLTLLPSPSNGESAGSSDKTQFEKPVLEKFTDMEDLLLLDPIHEVDLDTGWPNAKTA